MTKSETQLTLQDELKTVGSKNGTGDLTHGQQQAVLALFQQALTSLKSQMRELEKDESDESLLFDSFEIGYRNGFNDCISECQRVIELAIGKQDVRK